LKGSNALPVWWEAMLLQELLLARRFFDAKTAIVIFLEDVMRTASPSFAICLDVDRKHVVGS
jgi:hypothetical protein